VASDSPFSLLKAPNRRPFIAIRFSPVPCATPAWRKTWYFCSYRWRMAIFVNQIWKNGCRSV